MTETNVQPGAQPPVVFSLDGVEHTSVQRRLTAADILRQFGGLDPANYDLLRIVGSGEEQRYHGTDEVELVPHGVYVSFFTGPMPVE